MDTDPPSDSNVQERRNVPFISLIIISDVAAIHADIDPATRWPEIQGRKTNQNIEITKILEIKLFPNPCQSYTNIAYTLAEDSEVNIEVYNIQGEQVACINNNEYQLVGEHRAEIDMSHLANGTYICRVSQSNGEVASQRFVKME